MSMAGVVQAKGAAVTFSLATSTYDATTDTVTTATATVAGHLLEIEGDLDEYRDLGLVSAATKTGLFTPTTAGEEPPKGATVTWGSETFAVRFTRSLALNGTPTATRVVMSR